MNTTSTRSVAILAAIVASVFVVALSHARHAQPASFVIARVSAPVVQSQLGDTSVPAASTVFAGRADGADEVAPTF